MEKELLNNNEFSALTGIPSSTLRKWLLKGKIKGVKRGGQWMIPKSQLQHDNVLARTGGAAPSGAAAPPPPAKKKASAAPAAKKAPAAKAGKGAYSIPEFSELTYLTESGVEEWLISGRLSGAVDDQGAWRVDAANLETPDIKRLVRE
ncbi:MAG: helix-turn-helix domain-containing protein [Desulfobacterales bacterium]|nr:helix-turn-helix domain-containing protein [Desulfobacterales bacterium]